MYYYSLNKVLFDPGIQLTKMECLNQLTLEKVKTKDNLGMQTSD